MKKTLSLFLFVLSGLIAGCSTTRHTAPVVDLATQSGNRAASDIGGPRVPDERGYYTVRKGDTLNRIAQDVGQSARDLVVWNQLGNPNDIRVDQVLRVVPPVGAAQVGSIGAGSGVEARPLPAQNGSANNALITKNGPRGDKRPFSEAALAELQKPDSNGTSSPRPVDQRPVEPKTADSRSAEKAVDSAGPSDDSVAFIWPAEGRIVGNFEEGKKGIDIAGRSGQQVIAAAGGKVMYAGSGIRGYGNLVIVKHSASLLSAYAHNKSILVKEGQNVSKGEKIAEMGNSDSESVKLHFEIRQQGKPVDPSRFLPAK